MLVISSWTRRRVGAIEKYSKNIYRFEPRVVVPAAAEAIKSPRVSRESAEAGTEKGNEKKTII